MSDKVRPYNKFEYCKATACNRLAKSKTHADQFRCLVTGNDKCPKSAKQFHAWLEQNGFFLLKRIEDE